MQKFILENSFNTQILRLDIVLMRDLLFDIAMRNDTDPFAHISDTYSLLIQSPCPHRNHALVIVDFRHNKQNFSKT